MTQYNERVTKQRTMLEAEEWAKGIKSYHAHSLDTCWYDKRPDDTANGTRRVIDTQYNSGTIRRELDTGEIIVMGEELKGIELFHEYQRHGSPLAQ